MARCWEPFVGRKVVCTEDAWVTLNGETCPRTGETYTIRRVRLDTTRPGIFLQLEEIVNEPHRYVEGMEECAFDIKYFRPLVDRRTDISSLRALLGSPAAQVDARLAPRWDWGTPGDQSGE